MVGLSLSQVPGKHLNDENLMDSFSKRIYADALFFSSRAREQLYRSMTNEGLFI